MSDKIKPSEVSEIRVKELQGINSEEKFMKSAQFSLSVMVLHVSMDFVMLKPMSCLNLKMAPCDCHELGRRQCWLYSPWSNGGH